LAKRHPFTGIFYALLFLSHTIAEANVRERERERERGRKKRVVRGKGKWDGCGEKELDKAVHRYGRIERQDGPFGEGERRHRFIERQSSAKYQRRT